MPRNSRSHNSYNQPRQRDIDNEATLIGANLDIPEYDISKIFSAGPQNSTNKRNKKGRKRQLKVDTLYDRRDKSIRMASI